VSVLKNVKANRFLNVMGGGTTNGANVYIWDTWTSDNSHWKIQQVAHGVYTLRNVNSGLYLSESGGGNAHLWNNPGSNDTRWEIEWVKDQIYTLRNVDCGKYLNVAAGGTHDGANVIVWNNPEAPESQWKIVTQEKKLTWQNVAGSGGSDSDDTSYDEAWDKDPSTYFDAANSSDSYTAVELRHPSYITTINYQPRKGFSSRMVGGRFEAAPESTSGPWDILGIVSTKPRESQFTPMIVNSTSLYRWVRYYGPSGGFSNVAEISLRGVAEPEVPEPEAGSLDNATWGNESQMTLAGSASGVGAGRAWAEAAAASGAASASTSGGGGGLTFPTFPTFPTLSTDQWRTLNYVLLAVFCTTCLSALILGLLPKKTVYKALCHKRKKQKIAGRLEVFGQAEVPGPKPIPLPPQPSYSQVATTVPIMAPQHVLPPADPVDRYSQGFIDAIAATAPSSQRPHGLQPSAMWVPLKK
jgi:hypothetical protein